MNDWETEFPLGEIFCESFIIGVLKVSEPRGVRDHGGAAIWPMRERGGGKGSYVSYHGEGHIWEISLVAFRVMKDGNRFLDLDGEITYFWRL